MKSRASSSSYVTVKKDSTELGSPRYWDYKLCLKSWEKHHLVDDLEATQEPASRTWTCPHSLTEKKEDIEGLNQLRSSCLRTPEARVLRKMWSNHSLAGPSRVSPLAGEPLPTELYLPSSPFDFYSNLHLASSSFKQLQTTSSQCRSFHLVACRPSIPLNDVHQRARAWVRQAFLSVRVIKPAGSQLNCFNVVAREL